MINCQQKPICTNPAFYKMYWPGSEPRLVCEDHRQAAKQIASAMEFYLHFELIGMEEVTE